MEARLIQNISNAPANRLMPHVPATLTKRLLCAMCLLCFSVGKLVTCERGAPGPHAHGNTVRKVVNDRRAEVRGQRKPSNDPRSNQHNPGTPTTGQLLGSANISGTRRNRHSPSALTTGLRKHRNNTSRSTGRSSRQTSATRQRSMRRKERVTVQGLIKKQQPDGMSHTGRSEQGWGRARVCIAISCHCLKRCALCAQHVPISPDSMAQMTEGY